MSAGRWFYTSAFGHTATPKRAAATKAPTATSTPPPPITAAEHAPHTLREVREHRTG